MFCMTPGPSVEGYLLCLSGGIPVDGLETGHAPVDCTVVDGKQTARSEDAGAISLCGYFAESQLLAGHF